MKNSDGLQKLDYGNIGHINRKKRGWTNSMETIPRVRNQQVAYKGYSRYEGHLAKKRPRKDTVLLII